MSKNLYPRGFTLLELLIAVAILVIVMTIAIPSFQSVIQNNYSIHLTNELINSLNYARSEAVHRGTNVSVCAAADQTFSSCGSNWNQGWLIFVDPAGAGTFNSASTLLRTQPLTGQNANINTLPTSNAATYNSTGFANAATTNLVFKIYATGCQGDSQRLLSISMTGKMSVSTANCP